jgi:arylsulfatase A-like enzyme
MRVVVLHAGALHLGYIGCYGCDWVDTPNLDRLAAEGVVFDRHYADQPAEQASPFAFRQRFPSPTGMAQGENVPRLPEILRAHGIDPLILELAEDEAGDFPSKKLSRWARGDNPFCCLTWPTLAPPWKAPEEFLAAYFSTADDEGEPLLPWLDPPTGPFDDEGTDRERLQNSYAAVMSLFDVQCGRALDELAGADNVLICVTSSSGLALGEHGYVGNHRAWLHEEIVHVPLILRLPRAAEAGLRVSALTQPVDLLPTFLAALSLPPVDADGVNLLPLVRGEVGQVRSHACSGLAIGDSIEWAVRTPEWAYLLPLGTPPDDPPRPAQLFVKPDDRWEVNDVRQHYVELADDLERVLRDAARAANGP